MLRLVFVAFVILAAATTAAFAESTCFTPLQSPNSTNKADWKALADYEGVVESDAVILPLTVKNGLGNRINLDYYGVTFSAHPTKSLVEVFRDLRNRFEFLVARTETSPYERDESGFGFVPYAANPLQTDPVRAKNLSLWRSADPKGAVMSFVLASYTPALVLKAHTAGRRVQVALEQGDVAVTCASATDFIFSTVKTRNNGFHPVSGNRGFGMKDNGNGTWTFYTMGADRETKTGETVLETGERLDTPYFNNEVAKVMFARPGSSFDPDAVFMKGHEFWVMFFDNLIRFLDGSGMTVGNSSLVRNSRRYAYP